MSISHDLRTALFLDRLASTLGIDPNAEEMHDPLAEIIAEGDRQLDAFCAELATDEIMKARRRAQDLEHRYPGYAEELNRQRKRLGLPLL